MNFKLFMKSYTCIDKENKIVISNEIKSNDIVYITIRSEK